MLECIRSSDKPVVVLCDDAYQGFVYEDGLMARSPFFELADADPERILAVKIDGATKELMFFGSRVGFITFAASSDAAPAIEDKLKGCTRATVSSAPGISQALVLSALQDPTIDEQRAVLIAQIAERYRTLKAGLLDVGLKPWPFNSGFFALLPLDQDPEDLRQRLLADGVGVVAFAGSRSIRLAYSSTSSHALPALVKTLTRHVG